MLEVRGWPEMPLDGTYEAAAPLRCIERARSTLRREGGACSRLTAISLTPGRWMRDWQYSEWAPGRQGREFGLCGGSRGNCLRPRDLRSVTVKDCGTPRQLASMPENLVSSRTNAEARPWETALAATIAPVFSTDSSRRRSLFRMTSNPQVYRSDGAARNRIHSHAAQRTSVCNSL